MQHHKVPLDLSDLPAEQRDVVEWIYYQGTTRREIARTHNIPCATIKSCARVGPVGTAEAAFPPLAVERGALALAAVLPGSLNN